MSRGRRAHVPLLSSSWRRSWDWLQPLAASRHRARSKLEVLSSAQRQARARHIEDHVNLTELVEVDRAALRMTAATEFPHRMRHRTSAGSRSLRDGNFRRTIRLRAAGQPKLSLLD